MFGVVCGHYLCLFYQWSYLKIVLENDFYLYALDGLAVCSLDRPQFGLIVVPFSGLSRDRPGCGMVSGSFHDCSGVYMVL